jgi:hypothetical protein
VGLKLGLPVGLGGALPHPARPGMDVMIATFCALLVQYFCPKATFIYKFIFSVND